MKTEKLFSKIKTRYADGDDAFAFESNWLGCIVVVVGELFLFSAYGPYCQFWNFSKSNFDCISYGVLDINKNNWQL